jgi:hypothetical protein
VAERASADRAQAEYFVALFAAMRLVLEIEIAERCVELLKIPWQTRRAERGRNIRRLIRAKADESAALDRLIAGLLVLVESEAAQSERIDSLKSRTAC